MRPTALHGLLILASLGAVLAIAFGQGFRLGPPPPAGAAMIAVEHDAPAAVAISVARSAGGRLVELTNSGGKTIFASVPEAWERTEVRGAPIAASERSATAFGFTRWSVPGTATVAFRGADLFDAIAIANPSGLPLSVRLTTVDLGRDATHVQSVIVTDAPVTLSLLSSDD